MGLRARWRQLQKRRRADKHQQALTDLDATDKIVNSLIQQADGLVTELRQSLSQAMTELRASTEGADDDRR